MLPSTEIKDCKIIKSGFRVSLIQNKIYYAINLLSNKNPSPFPLSTLEFPN